MSQGLAGVGLLFSGSCTVPLLVERGEECGAIKAVLPEDYNSWPVNRGLLRTLGGTAKIKAGVHKPMVWQ